MLRSTVFMEKKAVKCAKNTGGKWRCTCNELNLCIFLFSGDFREFSALKMHSEFSLQMNVYPWYRDSVGGQLGQLCGPMATTIKTENGYNDCMLALDYATQSKVRS